MDDQTRSVPHRVVIRGCENSRFHGQLLAAAYRRVVPEARVTLGEAKASANSCYCDHPNTTIGRCAAGA